MLSQDRIIVLLMNRMGDFNRDGIVDISDIAKVAYMVVGKTPVDPATDFNANGAIDIGDAAKIVYSFIGKIGGTASKVNFTTVFADTGWPSMANSVSFGNRICLLKTPQPPLPTRPAGITRRRVFSSAEPVTRKGFMGVLG
jgi:hypothetical protein